MINLFGRCAALVSCIAVVGLSAPAAGGSGNCVPDPRGTLACTPSTTTSFPVADSPFSLLVSPTRLALREADVGRPQRFLVVNRGADPVSVTVQKRDFIGDADGSLAFPPNAPYAAASWLAVAPDEFDIAPGAAQAVTATVTVPSGPEPGDHQVALVFMVPAGQTTANIRINRAIAAPVFITVAGPVDDSALISDLHAPEFVIGGSVDVTARIDDIGTVHRDFRGPTKLVVDGGGGGVAFPDFTVLRDSTRDISTTWHPPLLCLCDLSVSFRNANGMSESASVRVIVFPLWVAVGLIVFLLLLLAFIRWRRRRRRQRAEVDHA